MRDRLIELLYDVLDARPDTIADYLLANGVIVFDTKVITPQNRPLITHIAEMPSNDVLDLIRAKKEQAEQALMEREG